MSKSTKSRVTEQVDFHLENGNSATADFSGGDISGLGGLGLLALCDDAYEFIKGAARCIKDTRNQKQIVHEMENLLRQAVFLCAAGYPDGIDSNALRADPMLKMCLGWNPDGEQHGASQASSSRFLTERSGRDLKRLFSYFIWFYIKKHKEPPAKVELDFDGSSIEAHGRQQYICFNGHYEVNMYFPLFVLDENGWIISPILRPGNVSDAAIAVDVLAIIAKRLRKAWPEVKLLFRGDAAFHDPDIMDWCEENNVDYISGLKSDNSLNARSKKADTAVKTRFKRKFGEPKFIGDSKKRHEELRAISALEKEKRQEAYKKIDERQVKRLGDFYHKVGDGYGGKHKKWKKERRVISLSRYTDSGLKRRYLVTSLENLTKEELYDEIYSKRGKAELAIRSLKALGAHRMNSQEAETNQMKLLVQSMACNLLRLVAEQVSGIFDHMAVETFIHEIVCIPVQVKVSTRRIWMRWTGCYTHQKKLLKLCKRLNALPKPA